MSDASLPLVVVVGLGPAGPDLTTAGAQRRIAELGDCRLRTRRHPAAAPFHSLSSYDHLYEANPTFEDVYADIVEDLVSVATAEGEVGYVVPGSPFVLESSVRRLLADERVRVEVVPGMSFLDLVWRHVPVDPIEARVSLIDGHRFAVDAAGVTGAVLVAHCHSNAVLSDIKLAFDEVEPDGAVVLQRLGLEDEAVTEVDWADLDRAVQADHLTSVFVPAVTTAVGSELIRFDELVRTLRSACPWDRQQTHRSLRPYVLEEAYEVADAIDSVDVDTGAGVDDLAEELGDLLFQVYFHAAIAAERGDFNLADVARGIHDKLVRRHPHVFEPESAGGDVAAGWEAAKLREKDRTSVMEGIPSAMGALAFADKVLSKMERIGVAPPDLDERSSLGTSLLALVIAARDDGLDAEAELRAVVRDLRDQAMEAEGAATPPQS